MSARPVTKRMTAEERRQSIIHAIMDVFAKKGFDGTTTRELAGAAGVSEALLFKHFPNKEALYTTVLESCALEPGFAELLSNRILGLEPSSSTLVIMVHFVMSHFVKGFEEKCTVDRLAVQSLLSDGAFLRLTIKKAADTWIHKFEDCLKAAMEAGDVLSVPVRKDLRFWFTQHIAFSLRLHLKIPETPALDYKVSKDKLIEQAAWFALLGIGMKAEAIKRHYHAKSLAIFDKK